MIRRKLIVCASCEEGHYTVDPSEGQDLYGCSLLWRNLIEKIKRKSGEEPLGPCPLCGAPCYFRNGRVNKWKRMNDSMDKIDGGADPLWKHRATQVIIRVCDEYDVFTMDDIWREFKLEHGEFAVDGTSNLSAITQRVNRAIENGWCFRLPWEQGVVTVRRVKTMHVGSGHMCCYKSMIRTPTGHRRWLEKRVAQDLEMRDQKEPAK